MAIVLGTDVQTYAAMIVGFWSLEFLDGWGGVALTFSSTAWVLYQLGRQIFLDVKSKKNKKK